MSASSIASARRSIHVPSFILLLVGVALPAKAVRDSVDIAPGRFGRAVATCPTGFTMLADGFQFSFFDRAYTKIVGSLPTSLSSPTPNAWAAEGFNEDVSTGAVRRIYAVAMCGGAS